MVKPELGNKRVCVNCSAKFYDLGRSPAVCPKCETEQPLEQVRPRRPPGNLLDDKRPKKPVAADEPETEVAEEDGEDETIEDAAELEDDDADAIEDDIVVESDGDEPER